MDAACLTRLRVTTAVLELTVRAAAGDLAVQADLEAVAALLGRRLSWCCPAPGSGDCLTSVSVPRCGVSLFRA